MNDWGSSVDCYDTREVTACESPRGLNVTTEILMEDDLHGSLMEDSELEDSISRRAQAALDITRDLNSPCKLEKAKAAESLVGIMYSAMSGDIRSAACSVSPNPSRSGSRQSVRSNASRTGTSSSKRSSQHLCSTPKSKLKTLPTGKEPKCLDDLNKMELIYQMELLAGESADSILSEPELFGGLEQQTMDLLSAAGNLEQRRDAHGGYGTPSSYASEMEMNMYFDNQQQAQEDSSFWSKEHTSVSLSEIGKDENRASTDTGVESILTGHTDGSSGDSESTTEGLQLNQPNNWQAEILNARNCRQPFDVEEEESTPRALQLLGEAWNKCEKSVIRLERFVLDGSDAAQKYKIPDDLRSLVTERRLNKSSKRRRRHRSLESTASCPTNRLRRMLHTASSNMIDLDASRSKLRDLTTPDRSRRDAGAIRTTKSEVDRLDKFLDFQHCLQELRSDCSFASESEGEISLNRSKSMSDCNAAMQEYDKLMLFSEECRTKGQESVAQLAFRDEIESSQSPQHSTSVGDLNEVRKEETPRDFEGSNSDGEDSAIALTTARHNDKLVGAHNKGELQEVLHGDIHDEDAYNEKEEETCIRFSPDIDNEVANIRGCKLPVETLIDVNCNSEDAQLYKEEICDKATDDFKLETIGQFKEALHSECDTVEAPNIELLVDEKYVPHFRNSAEPGAKLTNSVVMPEVQSSTSSRDGDMRNKNDHLGFKEMERQSNADAIFCLEQLNDMFTHVLQDVKPPEVKGDLDRREQDTNDDFENKIRADFDMNMKNLESECAIMFAKGDELDMQCKTETAVGDFNTENLELPFDYELVENEQELLCEDKQKEAFLKEETVEDNQVVKMEICVDHAIESAGDKSSSHIMPILASVESFSNGNDEKLTNQVQLNDCVSSFLAASTESKRTCHGNNPQNKEPTLSSLGPRPSDESQSKTGSDPQPSSVLSRCDEQVQRIVDKVIKGALKRVSTDGPDLVNLGEARSDAEPTVDEKTRRPMFNTRSGLGATERISSKRVLSSEIQSTELELDLKPDADASRKLVRFSGDDCENKLIEKPTLNKNVCVAAKSPKNFEILLSSDRGYNLYDPPKRECREINQPLNSKPNDVNKPSVVAPNFIKRDKENSKTKSLSRYNFPTSTQSASTQGSSKRSSKEMEDFRTPVTLPKMNGTPKAPRKIALFSSFESKYRDLDRKIDRILKTTLSPEKQHLNITAASLEKKRARTQEGDVACEAGDVSRRQRHHSDTRRNIFSDASPRTTGAGNDLRTDSLANEKDVALIIDELVDDTALKLGEEFLSSSVSPEVKRKSAEYLVNARDEDEVSSVGRALRSIRENLNQEQESAEKLRVDIAESWRRMQNADSWRADNSKPKKMSPDEAEKSSSSKVRTLEEVVALLRRHVSQRELEIEVLGKQLAESNSRIKGLERKLNDKNLDEYRMTGLRKDKDELYLRLNHLLSDRDDLQKKIGSMTREKDDAVVAARKANDDLLSEKHRSTHPSSSSRLVTHHHSLDKDAEDLKERVDELEVLNRSSASELERAERELNSLKREKRSLLMSSGQEMNDMKADHMIMREKLDRMHEISAENLLLHTDVADYQKELSELRDEARLLRAKCHELSEENRQCKAEVRDLRRYMDLLKANKGGDSRQDLVNKIEYYQMEHDRLLDEVRHLRQRLGDVSPRSPLHRSTSPPPRPSSRQMHTSPSKQSVRFSSSLERGRSPVTDALAASTASSYGAARVQKDKRSLSPSAALNVRDLTMDRYARHMEGPESGRYDCANGRESPQSDDSECTEFLLKPQCQINGSVAPPPVGCLDSDDDLDAELHISSLRNGKSSNTSSSTQIRSGSDERVGGSPTRRSRSPCGSPVGFRSVSPRMTSSQKCVQDTARDRYPTKVSRSLPRRAFAPRNPSDIMLGYCIKFTRPGGKLSRGTVRYIGHLPTRNEIFVGVELDGHDGKHSGTYQGTKYFTCPTNKGVFTPFSKVIMAWE